MSETIVEIIDTETVMIETKEEDEATVIETTVGPRGPVGPDMAWETTQW